MRKNNMFSPVNDKTLRDYLTFLVTKSKRLKTMDEHVLKASKSIFGIFINMDVFSFTRT